MWHYAGKVTMENEELSVIVWCWHDLPANATRLRVVGVATGGEVLLNGGSFLLRISIDAKSSVTRCYIRHIGSGREAYVQGGPNLRAFVKTCLLGSSKPEESAPPEATT
jgi:hypothetical protein